MKIEVIWIIKIQIQNFLALINNLFFIFNCLFKQNEIDLRSFLVFLKKNNNSYFSITVNLIM
jgi:hypothetical protein